MSFSKNFDIFRDKARVVLNDLFIGDQGAHELASFLADHGRVESLEIKSNNLTGTGFIEIFKALEKNPNLRQFIAQYNDLGANDYENWHDALGSLIARSGKLERLNISNNKISGQGFSRLVYPLSESKSLKLLEIRYNAIGTSEIEHFVSQLKNANNTALLFVQISGNKISKQTVQSLQAFLKNNRKNNPISKDKLMMTGGFYDNKPQNVRSQTSFNRTNAIDDLSKQNILAHLENILDQNRKDTAQMKARLQNELSQLQRRQKIDAKQLNELDTKCNELIIQNRNLKFEYDRTISEHQQMERDQEYHLRVHEEKVREANKELQQLESKYEELQNRMNKEHEMKMKQIAREWEARLRNVQEKIRSAENDNSLLENQIRKHLEKRQRLKMEYVEEQNLVRTRVEDEETQRYNFKLSALESRLQEVEESREKYLRRNQDIIYELQKCETENNREITLLEDELTDLRAKEEEFVAKNKDFVTRNERLKNEIQMKELSIEKLEEQINRFNDEIELKKSYNREQIQKIITDNEYDRSRRQEQKTQQIQKMTELQTLLRNAQLENAKLRQQYAILAQKLQISLGKAVQQVFTENNLY